MRSLQEIPANGFGIFSAFARRFHRIGQFSERATVDRLRAEDILSGSLCPRAQLDTLPRESRGCRAVLSDASESCLGRMIEFPPGTRCLHIASNNPSAL
jgi:hypothetical protein